MHLVIPFAAPLAEPGHPSRAALASLRLPALRALLQQLPAATPDDGDAWSLTPPHERVLARALGLRGGDGQLPWAARAAAADGIDTGDLAWGLVTPTHWHVGTEQVSLMDPAALLLAEDDARALFDAVHPLCAGDGTLLLWGAPTRWYLAHESLAELPTASLDRVIGRNVDAWLGNDPAARRVRRLQAEWQMLLHAHPVNAARAAQGLLPVNSFWLSGCGAAQPVAPEAAAAVQVDDRLRGPALAEDWPGWCRAWETLDAGPLRALLQRVQRGDAVALSLCGERRALTLSGGPGRWGRLARWFVRPDPAAVLEPL